MQTQPILKLSKTKLDYALELSCWSTLLITWAYFLFHYPDLPDIIPIHYNAAGEADGFGGKEHLFGLYGVEIVLILGLSILNRYPHIFNYATEITVANAERQYRFATRMIRFLQLGIAIIFGLIGYESMRDPLGQSEGLGRWFLPAVMVLIFVPVGYFLIKSMREDKKL